MHAQPLTAAEFEFIEDTLLKYGDDHSVLNLAELDGYFTALVSMINALLVKYVFVYAL